jgi:predicted nucleic acid-binding protein
VQLVDSLSGADTVLLWQVLCEFGAVLTKLRAKGRAAPEALDALGAYRDRFPLVMPGPHIVDEAIKLHVDHRVSYWDAMIIAACADAGVSRRFSEDVQSQPEIHGVEIINPFDKM